MALQIIDVLLSLQTYCLPIYQTVSPLLSFLNNMFFYSFSPKIKYKTKGKKQTNQHPTLTIKRKKMCAKKS